jgi:hypothetical protein
MIPEDKLKHGFGSFALVLLFFAALALLKKQTLSSVSLSNKQVIGLSSSLTLFLGLLKELTDYLSWSWPLLPPCPCHCEFLDVVADAVGVLAGAVLLACLVRTRGLKDESELLPKLRPEDERV